MRSESGNIEFSTIMQSYVYRPLHVGPEIGFQERRGRRKVIRPARKLNDLERLPPLSSRVAAEIEHRLQVEKQALSFARIREVEKMRAERERRERRSKQHAVPPYVPRVRTHYRPEDLEAAKIPDPHSPEERQRKVKRPHSRQLQQNEQGPQQIGEITRRERTTRVPDLV